MSVIRKLYEDIPQRYSPVLKDNRVALCECPICGHVTQHLDRGATAFIETADGNIAFKCFYCDNGGKKGGTFVALKELSLYDKYATANSGKADFDFDKGFSPMALTSVEEKYLKRLKPVEKGSEAYKYLESRGLEKYASVMYDFRGNILYPCEYDGKIYGGQYRFLPQVGEKIVRFFKTDKYGSYYAIFRKKNIDISKPIYVFEGVEDCLSCGKENAIAIFGLTFEKALRWFGNSKLVFCFDNDAPGKDAMIKIYERYPDRFWFLAYDETFGEYKDFNDRLKSGYSFEDNNDYISSHIIKNPVKYYKKGANNDD